MRSILKKHGDGIGKFAFYKSRRFVRVLQFMRIINEICNAHIKYIKKT